MKIRKKIKVSIKRGKEIIIGTLIPPEKAIGRWTGTCDGVFAVTADTAEECADKLGGVGE